MTINEIINEEINEEINEQLMIINVPSPREARQDTECSLNVPSV